MSNRAIFAGLKAVGISDEDDRRDLFERITGTRSLRDMNDHDKATVVQELRRLGFGDKKPDKGLSGPYAKKLQALWIAAWNLGLVRDRKDSALLAFVKRQTGIDHTRFLQEAKEGAKAVEALKGWIKRETGLQLPMPGLLANWMMDYNAQIALAQWRILAQREADLYARERESFEAQVLEISAKRRLIDLQKGDWRKVSNRFGSEIRADNL